MKVPRTVGFKNPLRPGAFLETSEKKQFEIMLPSVSTNVREKEGTVKSFPHIRALGMGITT